MLMLEQVKAFRVTGSEINSFCICCFSVRLFVIPWTAARQAPVPHYEQKPMNSIKRHFVCEKDINSEGPGGKFYKLWVCIPSPKLIC